MSRTPPPRFPFIPASNSFSSSIPKASAGHTCAIGCQGRWADLHSASSCRIATVLSSAAATTRTSPVVVPNPLRRPGPAVCPTFLAAVTHVPAATSTTLPTNTTVGTATAVATAVLPTVTSFFFFLLFSMKLLLNVQQGYTNSCELINSIPCYKVNKERLCLKELKDGEETT